MRPESRGHARINAFDYFRAIAILLIVAGHVYGPWDIDTVAERALANIVTGGTSLFVFISGFFLHSHFYHTTGYAKFVKGKLRTVIAPYVMMLTAGFLFHGYVLGKFPFAQLLVPDASGPLRDIELWSAYLLTGRIFLAYWYIPFIAIIFALTPVFYAYIRLSAPNRWAMMGVWILASMLIQRPVLGLSPLHAVLYFVPIYMMGINYSLHRTGIDEFIRDKLTLLGGLVVGVALVQALAHTTQGNLEKSSLLAYNGIDFAIIQKLLLCLFCVALLSRIEAVRLPPLKLAASASFAIFFIHPWVIMLLQQAGWAKVHAYLPGMVVWLFHFAVVATISLAMAMGLKRLLGTRSRYVIGW